MTAREKIIRIDSLFAQLFKKKQWDKRLALYGIFPRWPKVVGRELAERTAPRIIRGTVLWVAVTDSVWMQQLHLQKQALLERINDDLGGSGRITDIRFQVDVTVGERKITAKPRELCPAPVVDPDKKRAFERMISAVGDVDLRARLLALWEKANRG